MPNLPFRHPDNTGTHGRRGLAQLLVLGLLVPGLALTAPSGLANAAPSGNTITDGFNNSVLATVTVNDVQYVGGQFTAWGPQTGGGAVVDAASGTLNRTFPEFVGEVRTSISDGSGGLYVGGYFDRVGSHLTGGVAHILANGSVDTNFQAFFDSAVRTLALSGDVLYVGGDFECVGRTARPAGACTDAGEETPRNNLAALSATDGQLLSWDPNPNGEVLAIAVQGARIFVGGGFEAIGHSGVRDRPFLAELDAVTGDATSWMPDPNTVVTALLVSGTTLYVGGYFHNMYDTSTPVTRNNLASFDLSVSPILNSWNPDPSGGVLALAATGSTVYVGGSFLTVGGQTRNRIAALNASDGLATTWNPSPPDAPIAAITVIGDQVYAAGAFTAIGGLARSGAASISASDASITDWNPHPDVDNGHPMTLIAMNDEVFLGGGFTTINDWVPRAKLASINANGTLTSWAPALIGYVADLLVTDNRLYALGNFTLVDGVTRNGMAAFTLPSGGLTSWDPNAGGGSGEMNAWDISGNTIYVAGNFTTMGGLPRESLAAVDATTGAATGWHPDAPSDGGGTHMPGSAFDIDVDGDVVYIGGGFDKIGNLPHALIGALDSSLGTTLPWDPQLDGWNISQLAVVGTSVVFGGRVSCMGTYTRGGPCDQPNLGEVPLVGMGGANVTTGAPVPGWIHEFQYNANYPDGYPRTIDTVGDTTYIGGEFGLLDGQSVGNLAAFTTTGAVISSWRPMANGPVWGFEASGATATISGEFTQVNGLNPRYMQTINLYSKPTPAPDNGGGGSAPTPNASTAAPVVPIATVDTTPAANTPSTSPQTQRRRLGPGVVTIAGPDANNAKATRACGPPSPQVKSASRTHQKTNSVIKILTRGLPKRTKIQVSMRLGNSWVSMGRVFSDTSGTATLPAFETSKAGSYPLRMTSRSAAPLFTTIVTRKTFHSTCAL